MHTYVWLAFICLLLTGVASIIIVLLKSREQLGAKLKIKQAHDEAVRNFRENAAEFSGLYEPVLMIREGRLRESAGVFADWDTRIIELENVPELLKLWKDTYADYENWDRIESARKANELLAFTREAGVHRSEETEITINSDTSRYYVSNDDTDIEQGSAATVDIPYWALNDTVLEKGQISIIPEAD